MSKRFGFTEEERQIRWCFDIINPDLLDEETLIERQWYLIEKQKLEHVFGVHDVGFQTDIELAGFTSYEVPTAKYPKLMQIWRDFFISQGYSCGEIYKIKKGTETMISIYLIGLVLAMVWLVADCIRMGHEDLLIIPMILAIFWPVSIPMVLGLKYYMRTR